jgi:cytochrome c oxidase subunit 2
VNRTDTVIAVAYGIAVVVGAVIALLVWSSTLRGRDIDSEKLERRERTWFFVVLAIMTSLLFATIFFVPYGNSAKRGAQVVRVVGVQFAWSMEPTTLKAGRQVVFYVTSNDVNHGFGVYDPNHVLVFQAQVGPGRVQKVVHTFSKPGTYTVLCLEFCGTDHHQMRTTFQVTA